MAKTLISKFGNITNIVNASYDELLEIHGMGPKKIDGMHNVLREQEAIYKTNKSE